ncbi:MAG: sigma-E processing peptidase SpoIIGA [Lachnospiraceae bacterium]
MKVYYEVYIDSLFVMNLMLNLMLLSLVNKGMKCTATHSSLLLGGAIGAFGECLLIVLTQIPLWVRLCLAYGVVSVVMAKVGLRIRIQNYKRLCQSVAALYLGACLFGGILTFLENQMVYAVGNIRVKIVGVLFGAYLSYCCLAKIISKCKAREQERKRMLCTVHIYVGEQTCELKALVDTGNGLYEPISGVPVSIIEANALKQGEIKQEQCPFRVIPYHSIGEAHGILSAIQVDRIEIQREGSTLVCEKAILGIYKGILSSTHQYQMILHPKLLED